MRVVYNGVVLDRVLTTKWDETIRYDETGVNSLGSLTRMAFEAYILPDPADAGGFASAYENAVGSRIVNTGHLQIFGSSVNAKIKKILRELEMPRKALLVYDDVTGVIIFEAYPEAIAAGANGTGLTPEQAQRLDEQIRCIDVNNGPKPISVSVLYSCREYHKIRFEIEVAKVRCFAGEAVKNADDPVIPSADIAKGIVVSNRCWTNESIDDNFYTTRVFSGKLTISKNTNTSVHSYRDCYYPPLEAGFRRESVRFSESSDGLSLSYIVTDKQIRNAAPYPVTQFSGRLDYSFEYTVERVSMQLTVVGSPFAHRETLLGIARATMNKKMSSLCNDKSNPRNVVPIKFDISENLGDPPSFSLNLSALVWDSTKAETTYSSGENGTEGSGSDTSTSSSSSSSTQKSLMGVSSFTNEEGRVVSVTQKVSSVLPEKDSSSSSTPSSTETGAPVANGSETIPFPTISRLSAYDFMATEIGEYFPDWVADNYNRWVYKREESQVPNPYGYNILEVQSVESKKDSKSNADSDRGYFQFIKTIASVPCAVPTMSRVTGTKENSEKSDYETVVVKQSEVVLSDPQPSGMTQAAIDYPYTLYKSYAAYSTDFHRVFKPTFLYNDFNPQFSSLFYPSPVIIDVANPTGKLFVTIEAERQNALPELPDPEEILTIYAGGEIEGGITSAEAQPGMSVTSTLQTLAVGNEVVASSNTKLQTYSGSRRTESPITFYCLKHDARIMEPKPVINGESVLYTILATYEYAMSRPLRKGDEVRLLLNPILTQSTCYYPKAANAEGKLVPKREKLMTLYNGNALNHFSSNAHEETSQSSSSSN